MALWGTTANVDEAKPKWLTAEQQKNVYATERGWVQLNGKGLEEVIVAIGGLAGGTSATAGLGAANVSGVSFDTTSLSVSGLTDVNVRVIFNERVTVTGNPQIIVTNTTTNATYTATYDATASGAATTSRNRMVFIVPSADLGAVVADDVLSVLGGQTITIPPGGAIVDFGTSLPSNLTIAEASTNTLTASA